MKNCSRVSASKKCSFGARPASVSGVFRPGLDRDVFGNLEAKDEVLGRRVEKLGPVLLARELVERQVAADRRERLGILLQASLLEFGLRELAPSKLAISA